MTKIDKKIYSVFNRYILIFILGLSDLVLFYFLFTKPTVLVSNFLLNLVSPTILFGNTILFKEVLIELVKACIAGSAYYLLIILALAIPNIKVTRRLKLIGFLFVSLFIFNTLRIFLLSLINSIDLFNTVHLLTWYFFTTAFVIVIWFSAVKLFKIKEVPIYSDIKFLLSLTKHKKSTPQGVPLKRPRGKKAKKAKRSKKN